MTKTEFKTDLLRRIGENKPSRWVRFSIVMLIYLGWVCWVGNWWLLLGAVLLFDIYITGYIPFTWWKRSKSGAVRSVMSWVDAIVYALVLVYFVFSFVGQNYSIPSSSLEKTLLTGDYLFVNKAVYGPRVPMTPIYFPLAHNEMPIVGGNSYVESVRLPYHRLKGLRSPERGDIVVFNFPAGDTVMSKVNNPDYYSLCRVYGRQNVLGNEATFGKQIYRPVDRRENYVKRLVGLPGERISIVDGIIHIDGEPIPQPKNVQFNHLYQVDGGFTDEEFEALGIAKDDRHQVSITPADLPAVAAMGFTVSPNGYVPPIYISPLTAEMVEQMESNPKVNHVILDIPTPEAVLPLFPEALSSGWTRANYGGEGGILIPKKGLTIRLNQQAWDVYGRTIRVYEDNPSAEWRNGQAYIDGQPADTYTFKMDYYFMMGDNRDNSLDSRYWGFVPEDHIVGTPWRVLVSFDKDKNLLTGIRWNRVLKDANPDKPAFSAAAAE